MLKVTEADLNTQLFKDVKAIGVEEGRETGRREGKLLLVLRLLERCLGAIAPETKVRVEALEVERLEELAIALLDFEAIADLEQWLE